jgi:hypothetical protein
VISAQELDMGKKFTTGDMLEAAAIGIFAAVCTGGVTGLVLRILGVL